MARLKATAAALILALLPGSAATAAPVDLRAVERTGASNDALACPADLCRAEADRTSPVFEMTVDALAERMRDRLLRAPRTELVGEFPALHQLVLVQRSAFWGFPDTIRAQAVETAAGTSVILYSRSEYGRWDFGVNRARVDRWLALLAGE